MVWKSYSSIHLWVSWHGVLPSLSKSEEAQNAFSELDPPLWLEREQRLNINDPEQPFLRFSQINSMYVPYATLCSLHQQSLLLFFWNLILSRTLSLFYIFPLICFLSLLILDSIYILYLLSFTQYPPPHPPQRSCWLYCGPQCSNPMLLGVL